MDLVHNDDEGNPVVSGICNLFNRDEFSNEDDLREILIKRKEAIGIPVSFLVIDREAGDDYLPLIDTINSILESDIAPTTELKIVCMDRNPYDSIGSFLSGRISHSVVVRADKEEDPNLILTNAMKKMKNAFVVVVEAGHLVYKTIREDVNRLINEDLKMVSLLEQEDGDFYGCMLFLAKNLEYFAFEDLKSKLQQIVLEVTKI